MELVLGSQSPRRRKLLAQSGYAFRCIVPDVEELSEGLPPRDLVLENALRKWHWCCKAEPQALILTADTTVECHGRILGKPRDRAEAHDMLRWQSGRVQHVHTGFVLAHAADGAPPAPTCCGVETSCVYFKPLSNDDIAAYIERVQPYDRAGAYDIDESGDLLIARFEGSESNVMGLPMERIATLLT